MALVHIRPGKYVVAVSGGVDSMVLLHMLVQQALVANHRPPDSRPATNSKIQLIVAHFDHGMRSDSREDRKLVQRIAKRYNLPCVCGLGRLGPDASEAKARGARYAFLRTVRQEHDAKAIITAHHQDDMLETAILNLLRGTGRRGLSSLGNTKELRRPMLTMTKKQILAYAKEHELDWREDSTNADDRYLRNYVRHHILSRFGEQGKAKLLQRVQLARTINSEIDNVLEKDLAGQAAADQLDRGWYLKLPYAVAREVMAAWLRHNGIINFDRALIDHLVVAAKTKRPGKLADVNAGYSLEFGKEKIQLLSRNRN